LRSFEKLRVLDAHAAGETKEVSVKRIGPDLIFGRLWERMCYAEINIMGVRMRRTKEVGEVVLKNRSPWKEVTGEREGPKWSLR
jgi:hypothetical protein